MDYMRCIKTGCDIFHGDLFFKNGTLILSGCPKESWDNDIGENFHYDFSSMNMDEIPISDHYSCFLVSDVFAMQEDFLTLIQEYESLQCFSYFFDKK